MQVGREPRAKAADGMWTDLGEHLDRELRVDVARLDELVERLEQRLAESATVLASVRSHEAGGGTGSRGPAVDLVKRLGGLRLCSAHSSSAVPSPAEPGATGRTGHRDASGLESARARNGAGFERCCWRSGGQAVLSLACWPVSSAV